MTTAELRLDVYPVRPQREFGESLVGFLYRHFSANGHRIPTPLLRAVISLFRSEKYDEREKAWALIERNVGELRAEDRQIGLEWSCYSAVPRRERRLRQPPSVGRFQVCPECLYIHGIHQTFWQLPLIDVCPFHGFQLARHCECGSRLSWSTLGPDWTCQCGRSVALLFPPRASWTRIRLATTIWASIDLPIPHGSLCIEPVEVGVYGLPRTYAMVAWLVGLRRVIAESSHPPGTGDSRRVTDLGRFLAAWPNRLVRTLQRLLRFQYRHRQDEIVVDVAPESLTRRLIEHLEVGLTIAALPRSVLTISASVLGQIASPLSKSYAVIWNPALSQSEQQARIEVFWVWWMKVSTQIEPDAKRWNEQDAAADARLVSTETAEDIRIDLLNTMVLAAWRNIPQSRFAQFARAWPSSRRVKTLNSPDFMEGLYRQLEATPLPRLQYLREAARRAIGWEVRQ